MGQVFGNAFGAIDLRSPLGHAAVHPAVVDFLERFTVGHVAADLADEDDHGGRILRGGMNADGRIGRARAAGHERESRAAGKFAEGIRHVGGAAFLPADDELKALAHVDHGIENGEVALAGDAERKLRTLREQAGDEDFSARTEGHGRCGQNMSGLSKLS